ncbi:hypothetical protein OK016_17355 [Vibrio chagasii]|nr:hypothetical protein [Vibrio chagasii]
MSLTFTAAWIFVQAFDCEANTAISRHICSLNFASNVKITLKQSSALTPTSKVTVVAAPGLSIAMTGKQALENLYKEWKAKGISLNKHQKSPCWYQLCRDCELTCIRIFA